MTRSTDVPHEPSWPTDGSVPASYVAEEFYLLPEGGDRDELFQGSVVAEPRPSLDHGRVAGRLAATLGEWIYDHHLGELVLESGFVLHRAPDTVRGPDVAFVSRGRLAEHRGAGPFFEGAPDLTVEVLSPWNSRREMDEKATEYLEAGARLVWIVDPARRRVTIHRPEREPHHLGPGDCVDGGDVLPGFVLPVEGVFVPPDQVG